MHKFDSLSQHVPETLSGCWHRIGSLELRRLVLEGALLVIQESSKSHEALNSGIIVIPENSNARKLQMYIPDQEIPLVCLGQECGPADNLAAHLHNLGYQHVFTPETDWDGKIAIKAAGAQNLP